MATDGPAGLSGILTTGSLRDEDPEGYVSMTIEHADIDHRHARHAGLRYKIALIVIMVSLGPMILVSGIILYQFDTFSNEMVKAHLGELVLKHRQNIDDFLRQKLINISYIARIHDVDHLRDATFLQERLKVLQEEYGFVFVDLGLIHGNGRQVAYAGPFELQSADYKDSEWFQKAIQRDSYISDVFLGLRGQPHFIVAIKRHWNGNDWLFRATIDFAAFNTLVADLSLGQTGSAFILNREGEFQTRRPKGEPKLADQQYLNLFKRGEETLKIEQRLDAPPSMYESPVGSPFQTGNPIFQGYPEQGSLFSVTKADAKGHKFMIVAAFLKNNEWLLIFQQEFSDAFAKLKRTQLMAGLISLLGAMSIIVVASIVSGRMVKRITDLDLEKEMMNQQVIETGKLASVGELAAGIAHEINNPVAIMVEEAGWIQDLLEEGINQKNNTEEFRRALRQIENQGRRCKEITHKLLSFARKTDSRVQTVHINELITEMVDLLSQKSRYANVEVQVLLQPDLPAIQASVTEMQQVFMNILHNALDAMEKTGGKILISSYTDTGQVGISIADTGPGIPASNLGRLFDPFFTTKPVGKGTGLGLSICYGIVNKMGGRIEVESQVGKGTTFHVVLPLDEQAAGSQGA
jgi:two-component system NtrC family sensor kinase